VALFIFGLLFVGSMLMIELILSIIVPKDIFTGDFGFLCWITVMCLAFMFPLLSTIHVYQRVRWKFVGDWPPRCLSCGYNLFSNISGICPECGTPIPKEIREKLATEPPSSNAKIDTHGSQSVGEQNL